jgi:hypothetical protein
VSYYEVGNYVLKKLELVNYKGETFDLQGTFQLVELFEDIFSNTLSAKLVMNDSVGLLENFPIIGKEKLKFSYATTEDHSVVDVVLDIYNIPKIDKAHERNNLYALMFMSREGMVNSSKVVTRSMQGAAGSIVSGILKQELGTEKSIDFYPEPTASITVVPTRQRPFELIQTLLNRISSPESASHADYLLYETVDGYQLDSLSKLTAQDAEFTYKFGNLNRASTDAPKEDEFLVMGEYRIAQSRAPLSSITSGLYGGTLGKFDPITRTYKESTYDYNRDKDSYEFLGKEQFDTDEELQKNSVDGFFKYVITGTKDETYLHRTAKLEQLFNGVRIVADLAGNSDLRVGQVLKLDLPTDTINTEDTELHKKQKGLVGKYLVSSIKHSFTFNNGGYRSVVELVRDSLDYKLESNMENNYAT